MALSQVASNPAAIRKARPPLSAAEHENIRYWLRVINPADFAVVCKESHVGDTYYNLHDLHSSDGYIHRATLAYGSVTYEGVTYHSPGEFRAGKFYPSH